MPDFLEPVRAEFRRLDQLSRERALSDAESVMLEHCIHYLDQRGWTARRALREAGLLEDRRHYNHGSASTHFRRGDGRARDRSRTRKGRFA
jgi:hypothetical protein